MIVESSDRPRLGEPPEPVSEQGEVGDEDRAHSCTSYHKRGTAVCANSLSKRIETVNDALLTKLVGEVLRPAVIQAHVDGVLDGLNPRTTARDIDSYRKELQTLDHELARLAQANRHRW